MRTRRSGQRGARRELRRKLKTEFRKGDEDQVIQNWWPWAGGGGEVAGSIQTGAEHPYSTLKFPRTRLCSPVTSYWAWTVCLAVLSTLFCPHSNPERNSGRKCNAGKLFLLRSHSYKWWETRGPDSGPLRYSDICNRYPGSWSWLVYWCSINKKDIWVTRFRNRCIRNICYEA